MRMVLKTVLFFIIPPLLSNRLTPFSNDVGTYNDKDDMDTLGRRDDIEGSDTTQFCIIDKMVWLAEACLIVIKHMSNSFFDSYVKSFKYDMEIIMTAFCKYVW